MNTQLEALVSTLEAQNKVKKDYVAGSANLNFVDGKLILLVGSNEILYTPTPHFHSQISEKLHIPKPYYERMKEKAIELLDSNVNHWLQSEQKNFMVRSFEQQEGNIARAFLSDRYNIIDNYEVLVEALDAIKGTGLQVEICSAELSETRMYLKVIAPEVEVQAKQMLEKYSRSAGVDFGVISGFVLQNSEIGAGSFQIMPRGVVKVCSNGLVSTKDALKRVHLGGKMDELDFSNNENVRRANLKLIKEQVKHAVKVFLSKGYLEKLVNVYTALGDKPIEAPVANVIEVVSKEYGISEARKVSILDHFIRQGDTRRIGLVNALTEECQQLTDADAKHETECIAFDVLQKFNSFELKAQKTKFTTN